MIEEKADIISPESDQIVDWENPPTLEDLKQDLTEATSSHSAHEVEVDTWLNALNGNQVIKAKKGRSKIVPKLIRKQAEWRYSSLSDPFLNTDELFNTYPRTFEDKANASQNGQVLNYQFSSKLNKTKFIDEYVRTGVDEGTVVIKLGWEYADETIEVPVPDFEFQQTPDAGQIHQQLHGMMQQSPEQFQTEVPPEMQQAHQMTMQGGVPVVPVQVGSHMEEQTKIVRNQPTIDVCDYRNVVIDPTCKGDLDRAEFIIYSFDTSMSELEKDGRYINLDHVNLESGSALAQEDHSIEDDSNFTFKDKPRKKIVAYEYWGYWDINDTGVVEPIVATWIGDTLIRMEENPFPDKKLPFVLVQYLPKRNSVYGEPDGVLIEDNQKIVGAVTRGMIDIIGRSANGQVGSRKDALDTANARKFKNGEDYTFNSNVGPRQAFHMGTYPEIPNSAMNMLSLQNNEAESLTGVKAFSSGISGAALGDTATGIRSALDATSKRELGILRRLANGITQVGRKIISMNAEFLDDQEIIRITNDEMVEINRDDLGGDYDIKLSISTPEEDNQRAEQLAFMLQTMGNSMPQDMSQMILADIAKLRNMPTLAHKIENFQPQPDPMQQQKVQLEMQLLQAQIANETAKAQENQVDVGLKQAKTVTEEAKARAMHSGADLQDLDFVSKESGVDDVNQEERMKLGHQQAMEQKEFDRRKDLDSKTFDAMLNKESEVPQQYPGL